MIGELIPAAYRVMVNEVENGTIRANQETAAVGDIVSLSAELTEGYALYAWTVTDGEGNKVSVDDNTFTMPASDVTVSAQIYTEDIVELMNLLDEIDAMDASLYSEASWNALISEREQIYDATQLGKYASMMTTRLQSLVDALVPAEYKVNINKTDNGIIRADKTTAAVGDKISLSAEPEEGYALYAWTVTDGDGNEVPIDDHAFIMPASDVTVSAQIYTEDIVELMNLLDNIDAMDSSLYTEASWNELISEREQIVDATQLGKYASMMTSRLQSLVDGLVPVEGGDDPDSDFALEDGYYILPFQTYNNEEKTLTGSFCSGNFLGRDPRGGNRALLHVQDGK